MDWEKLDNLMYGNIGQCDDNYNEYGFTTVLHNGEVLDLDCEV